jgi:hypothetical protein
LGFFPFSYSFHFEIYLATIKKFSIFVIFKQIGWLPESHVNILTNTTITNNPASITSNTQMPPSQPSSHSVKSAQSSHEISTVKNYFLSIYAYVSNEPGDLNFREFEVINVVDRTEDWLTGQVVGSGSGLDNPLRHGIFPSNFVIKFPFPIDYIGKYTVSMAVEAYAAKNDGELTLNPAESQLIAIKKISPDRLFSFGESYVNNLYLKRFLVLGSQFADEK